MIEKAFVCMYRDNTSQQPTYASMCPSVRLSLSKKVPAKEDAPAPSQKTLITQHIALIELCHSEREFGLVHSRPLLRRKGESFVAGRGRSPVDGARDTFMLGGVVGDCSFDSGDGWVPCVVDLSV